MKIFRENIEFELSDDELYNAFLEQQNRFDKEDIISSLEYYTNDDYELIETLENNKVFIEEAAHELRRIIDKYNVVLEVALDETMRFILPKYVK